MDVVKGLDIAEGIDRTSLVFMDGGKLVSITVIKTLKEVRKDYDLFHVWNGTDWELAEKKPYFMDEGNDGIKFMSGYTVFPCSTFDDWPAIGIIAPESLS